MKSTLGSTLSSMHRKKVYKTFVQKSVAMLSKKLDVLKVKLICKNDSDSMHTQWDKMTSPRSLFDCIFANLGLCMQNFNMFASFILKINPFLHVYFRVWTF